jgi:hypothetical protein
MAQIIRAIQGNDINRDLSWDTETTPHLTGSGTRNLRARSAGSRLSLTGRITESGTFSVTITQTRTKTVTIEVGPRKSLGDMNVLEVRHHAYIP